MACDSFKCSWRSAAASGSVARRDAAPKLVAYDMEWVEETSWLQQGYVLHASASVDGPLTEWMKAEDFSDVVVPIHGTRVWLAILVFTLLLAAHEAYATRAKPLLANHERTNAVALQVVIVFSWICMFMRLGIKLWTSLFVLTGNTSKSHEKPPF